MTKKEKTKASQVQTGQWVWIAVVFLSLYLGYLLLKPYLAISALGILMAFMFLPMFEAFMRTIKSKGASVALTTLASLLIVAIPVMIVIAITISQALTLAQDLSSANIISGDANVVTGIEDLAAEANTRIESWFGITDAIASEDIESFLQSTIPTVLNAVRDALLGIVSGIPNFFTLFIVYLFVFTAVLSNGRELHRLLNRLSPFDSKTNERYLSRMGAMAKAMLKGQMVIALAQGVATAAVLSLVGFADYFFVFAIVFTFLSFIPLGAGIISIPLGILLLAIGDVAGGILVLLNHFIIVTNIDNVIRPKLVPKNAQLPAVLTILSAFGGVAMFGLIGVIYGPMIMIFITTSIESYLEYKESSTATTA